MAVTIASLLDEAPVSSGVPLRRAAPTGDAGPPEGSPKGLAPLDLRVLWGSLTQVPADVHAAGHYQGVLPAAAERALDEAISPIRAVIAEHTRRRWLVGDLGEVAYFPGRDPAAAETTVVRRAAVAGMGRLGTFTEDRARQMYGSLLRELGSLADVRSAAMVLIGSGAGNLSVPQAARALISGFTEVISTGQLPLTEVTIVEIDRLRAEQLLGSLVDMTRESRIIRVAPRVAHAAGGTVAIESAAVFAVRAIAQAIRSEDRAPGRTRKASLIGQLVEALPPELRERVPEALREIPDDLTALSVAVGGPVTGQQGAAPTRISVTHLGDRMRWAALTERATIPEREVAVKEKLVTDLISRLSAPSPTDALRLPSMLRQWIIPEDFQHHITAQAPLVLDVDSRAAQVPWEFLTDGPYEAGQQATPLAVRTPIARQLRTAYARAVADYAEPLRLRALVVADPGPPEQSLPTALDEGLQLAKLFRERGIDVTLYAGAPGSKTQPDALVATQLDVLAELLVGRYDIVHFAGHGTMSADRPDLAGWLFSDGVLTARELVQMTWAPRLVTANACWTAYSVGNASTAGAAAGSETKRRAELTAVLADEFLRVGVAHYIGTSWRIPDRMGASFATSFYSNVLPRPGRSGMPFGLALCKAREVLFGMRGPDAQLVVPETWSGWAAYQHFGDPADVLDAFEPMVDQPTVTAADDRLEP